MQLISHDETDRVPKHPQNFLFSIVPIVHFHLCQWMQIFYILDSTQGHSWKEHQSTQILIKRTNLLNILAFIFGKYRRGIHFFFISRNNAMRNINGRTSFQCWVSVISEFTPPTPCKVWYWFNQLWSIGEKLALHSPPSNKAILFINTSSNFRHSLILTETQGTHTSRFCLTIFFSVVTHPPQIL